MPDLSSVPGLADVLVKGDRMQATLLGDVAPFVRAVASPALVDLTIEPARLEEAFLEYYAGDEPANGPMEGPPTASAPDAGQEAAT